MTTKNVVTSSALCVLVALASNCSRDNKESPATSADNSKPAPAQPATPVAAQGKTEQPGASAPATPGAPAATPGAPAATPGAPAAPVKGEPIQVAELTGFVAQAKSDMATDKEQAALRAAIGDRGADCDEEAGDVHALRAGISDAAQGDELVVVSLAGGVVAFDGAGKVIADSGESIGCIGSQDSLTRAWAVQIVPDSEREIAVVYDLGGRRAMATDLAIFKRKGDKFVSIFTTLIAEIEAGEERSFKATLVGPGAIQTEGESGKATYNWDAAQFKLVKAP